MIIMQHAEMLMRLTENAAFKPGLEHKESLEEQIIGKVDAGSMQRAKMIIYIARRDAWSHNSGPWRRRRRT